MESNTPGIVGGFKSNFFVCLLVIEFVVALFEAEEEEEEEELAFVVVPTTAPVFSVFFFLATTEDASAAAAKLLPKPNKGIWWSRKSPLFFDFVVAHSFICARQSVHSSIAPRSERRRRRRTE
tara:strand:- start:243 stop:611 length:369 start_codon:yes stop_codon:yes gene_type:complete